MMEKIATIIFYLCICFCALFVMGSIVIWAINTLFKLQIAQSFWNIVAAAVLAGAFGNVKASVKKG